MLIVQLSYFLIYKKKTLLFSFFPFYKLSKQKQKQKFSQLFQGFFAPVCDIYLFVYPTLRSPCTCSF